MVLMTNCSKEFLSNMNNWQKMDTVTGVSGHTTGYKGREDDTIYFVNYIDTSFTHIRNFKKEIFPEVFQCH